MNSFIFALYFLHLGVNLLKCRYPKQFHLTIVTQISVLKTIPCDIPSGLIGSARFVPSAHVEIRTHDEEKNFISLINLQTRWINILSYRIENVINCYNEHRNYKHKLFFRHK